MKFLGILFFILSYLPVFGQSISSCDTIYRFVETSPIYEQGDLQGILKYLSNELIPLIGACREQDKGIIASICITFTIDDQGRVLDADISRPVISEFCKEKLKNKLLTMKGWKPAQKNGQAVCCYMTISVSCIRSD